MLAEPLGGGFVKAIYARDPLVTVPGGAIIGRMAVRVRRGEEAAVTREVAAAGLPILVHHHRHGDAGGRLVREAAAGPGRVRHVDPLQRRGRARSCGEVLARIGWELIVVPLPGYTIHIDLHLAMVDARPRAGRTPPGLPFGFLERLQGRGHRDDPPRPERGVGAERAVPVARAAC